ncbi:hypothetical protein MAPG_00161 [Magnaporthiopsis poae ATCC 64411]|uniref:Transmembrane protein n=1 Tax=Magnaporthiopsis poae (strain ATCC 64411 / 73-15) TaxID=644358 RepID=A0A0C4DK97_MAGP6|nr:hypothetical protein MAPG_00161 [Magnaporthiopsis poae ATCC 64411]
MRDKLGTDQFVAQTPGRPVLFDVSVFLFFVFRASIPPYLSLLVFLFPSGVLLFSPALDLWERSAGFEVPSILCRRHTNESGGRLSFHDNMRVIFGKREDSAKRERMQIMSWRKQGAVRDNVIRNANRTRLPPAPPYWSPSDTVYWHCGGESVPPHPCVDKASWSLLGALGVAGCSRRGDRNRYTYSHVFPPAPRTLMAVFWARPRNTSFLFPTLFKVGTATLCGKTHLPGDSATR